MPVIDFSNTFLLADGHKAVEGPFPDTRKKKSHKKSRLGCLECRTRKVKCDEAYPCHNCVKRGVSCTQRTARPASFQTPPQQQQQRRQHLYQHQVQLQREQRGDPCRELSPVPLSNYGGADASVNLMHMELFYHFEKVTIKTMVFRDLWPLVLQRALREQFLMNAMLCVSATHLATLRPNTTRHQRVSMVLLSKSIAEFRHALSQPVTSENLDPLLSTAMLIHHVIWCNLSFLEGQAALEALETPPSSLAPFTAQPSSVTGPSSTSVSADLANLTPLLSAPWIPKPVSTANGYMDPPISLTAAPSYPEQLPPSLPFLNSSSNTTRSSSMSTSSPDTSDTTEPLDLSTDQLFLMSSGVRHVFMSAFNPLRMSARKPEATDIVWPHQRALIAIMNRGGGIDLEDIMSQHGVDWRPWARRLLSIWDDPRYAMHRGSTATSPSSPTSTSGSGSAANGDMGTAEQEAESGDHLDKFDGGLYTNMYAINLDPSIDPFGVDFEDYTLPPLSPASPAPSSSTGSPSTSSSTIDGLAAMLDRYPAAVQRKAFERVATRLAAGLAFDDFRRGAGPAEVVPTPADIRKFFLSFPMLLRGPLLPLTRIGDSRALVLLFHLYRASFTLLDDEEAWWCRGRARVMTRLIEREMARRELDVRLGWAGAI